MLRGGWGSRHPHKFIFCSSECLALVQTPDISNPLFHNMKQYTKRHIKTSYSIYLSINSGSSVQADLNNKFVTECAEGVKTNGFFMETVNGHALEIVVAVWTQQDEKFVDRSLHVRPVPQKDSFLKPSNNGRDYNAQDGRDNKLTKAAIIILTTAAIIILTKAAIIMLTTAAIIMPTTAVIIIPSDASGTISDKF